MKSSTNLIFVALLCASAGHSIAAEPTGRPADRQSTVQLAQANAALASTRPAKFTSEGPGERGAVAAARQGPEALRQYIERTQGIYVLRYQDYLQQ